MSSENSSADAAFERQFGDGMPGARVQRNRLISKMLQDRSAVRLLLAPFGFGKTSLIREYAARMFSGQGILWIDGTKPEFLLELDNRWLQGLSHKSQQWPPFVVIDDLPWLHEERAETLCGIIEMLLYAGTEVAVAALPSCDSISWAHLDRVLIDAQTLLVTEQECNDWDERLGGALGSNRTWREANERLFGRLTAFAWGGADRKMQAKCLERLYEEKLLLELVRPMFAMMLLGSGTFNDLERVGTPIRDEDITMLTCSYPLFNLDAARRRFSVPQVVFQDLQEAIKRNRLEDALLGDGIMVGKILGCLFERSDFLRVSDIIKAFCTDERCGYWLLGYGWGLLDYGELALVNELFRRCPVELFQEHAELQAMQAWCSGLMGDGQEACYFARRVLDRRASASFEDGDEPNDASGVFAYLALIAFSQAGADGMPKEQFATGTSLLSAGDYLSSVVDLCTKNELQRALRPDDNELQELLDEQREPPSEERQLALETLLTGNKMRFGSTVAYRLSLHFLRYVDSLAARQLLQDLGREVVMDARRARVMRGTEALVIRDLWQGGFFGLGGPASGERDAALLESAARVIRRMCQQNGCAQADIPWETGCALPADKLQGVRDREAEARIARVRLFGTFEVSVGGVSIQESEWRKKARTLFIYLTLHQGRDVARDSIFQELWPGLSRTRALDNYYTAWGKCTSILGDEMYMVRKGEFCRIDLRYVHSDIAEFERLARYILTEHPDPNLLLDTYARMEAIYQGGLVPSETGCAFIDMQRERYKSMFTDSMTAAVDCALNVNDAKVALWFARKAFEVEAHREDVYYALMQAQVAAGQRCSAIRTYFKCKEFLNVELGLDPSDETQALYNRLITIDPSLLRFEEATFIR